MMKENLFGLLMLLLLIAVTPRNCCANPTASPDGMMDGAPAHFSGPTVDGTTEGAPAIMSSMIINDMKEGADILTAAMTWLKDNKTLSSHFDKIIRDLTIQIRDLHIELGEHSYDILAPLFKSQDRLEQLNTVLEQAATYLMNSCGYLVDIYESYGYIYESYGCSGEQLLKYTAEKFVSNANFVNDLFKEALKQTTDIQDLLSASKASIIEYNAKQDCEKEKIKAEQEAAGLDIKVLKSKLENQKQKLEITLNEDEQYTNKETILSCLFTLGFDCTISRNPFTNRNMLRTTDEIFADRRELERKIDIQEERQINIDKQSEQLNKTMLTLKSTTTLLPNVQDVKVYLEMEINLITGWQLSLKASSWYNEDSTCEGIKWNIKGIKETLNVLIKACEEYLEHELPDIF